MANRSMHMRNLSPSPTTGKHLRWLVTGSPGSGTMFVAELLTRAGLPTAHEMRVKGEYIPGPFDGESSSFGPLHFDEIRKHHPFYPSTFVIHLVRAPLNTIATIHAKAVLDLPEFADGAEVTLNGAAAFWVSWNQAILDVEPELRWRVDRISAADITYFADRIGSGNLNSALVAQALKLEPINQSKRPPSVSLSDLSPEISERVQDMASLLHIPLKVR